MYNNDFKTKENFEKWKRTIFTEYDKEAHDEFLKSRSKNSFYRYTGTQQFNQNHYYQNDRDFENSF